MIHLEFEVREASHYGCTISSLDCRPWCHTKIQKEADSTFSEPNKPISRSYS